MSAVNVPADLQDHLDAAGARVDADEAARIVRGVAAAPEDADGAWMHLIADVPTPALQEILAAMLVAARAAGNGLDARGTQPERVAALRAELGRRDLAGFIVPLADEHQGEYVAARSQRLTWLTGFTGSAGLAVVLAEAAAFFTDGRYTLQAEAQVDGALFERRHITEAPAPEWIAEHSGKGDKLGYDPWLMTPNQVGRYRTACREAGAELVAVDGNPVDAVWADQPPPPLGPVMALAETYAGESSAEKRGRMAGELADAGCGALVVTQPDSIAWLLNVRGRDIPYTPFALSFAVLASDGTVDWFVDATKLLPGVGEGWGDGVRIRSLDDMGAHLDALGKADHKVRVDPATAPSWAVERLKEAGATLDRAADPCQLAKAKKTPAQVDGMAAAHLRDGASVVRFLAWLDSAAAQGNLSEMAAADHLEDLRRSNDLFQGLSFPTIAGSGPNGAIVHYRVTTESDRTLGEGELFLVDSGAQYLDGTTDITRTMAIGTPSDDMRRHYTLVLKGHVALARVRFPKGTTGSQLDVLARQALWAGGLDYDHGTGHGVGSFLSVHEGPHRISKMPNRIALAPGMVVSNEPGYYKTGAYGIRIENLVVVTEARIPEGGEIEVYGFDTLTLAPYDRRLIDTELLSDGDVTWVDAYHRRVHEELSPLLDGADADWLRDATSPLR